MDDNTTNDVNEETTDSTQAPAGDMPAGDDTSAAPASDMPAGDEGTEGADEGGEDKPAEGGDAAAV